jgi:zinc transport system ATP-binding protein
VTAPHPSLLEITDLAVQLGGESVLQQVSLQVGRGTVHALIGPNGGGKTTLIRVLLGLLPYEGKVEWRLLREGSVGYVPQVLSMDPYLPLTVQDFLLLSLQRRPLFAGIQGPLWQRCCAVLEEMHVQGLVRRRLGELSGGERRRVLLAQALVHEPELLLLDEPEGGVDRWATERIEEALLQRKRAGATLIWVSHDLARVRRVADQVTCLQRRVRFDGVPEQVLQTERILEAFQSLSDHA